MTWWRRLEQWLLVRRINRALDAAARTLDYRNPPAPKADNVVHLPRQRPR